MFFFGGECFFIFFLLGCLCVLLGLVWGVWGAVCSLGFEIDWNLLIYLGYWLAWRGLTKTGGLIAVITGTGGVRGVRGDY